MRKSNILHKIVLFGALCILLTACADHSNPADSPESAEDVNTDTQDNQNSEDSEAPSEQEENEDTSEWQENNDHSSDNNTSEENEQASNNPEQETENEEASSNESQEETEEITEEHVSEIVFDYIEENEDFETEDVTVRIEDREEEREQEVYHAQVYSTGPEDAEQQATSTLRWYAVEKTSGEISNETPGMEEDGEAEQEEREPQAVVSEIVSMSEEDREEHHRNLASDEQEHEEQVFEHLLLPGVHENTRSYGGRVAPEDVIRFEFPSTENRQRVDPEVGEDGYFHVDMNEFEFSSEDVIMVRISGETYSREQVFELPVHPAEEGVEFIEVK
ncbi:hypothetical protein [Alkalicoccus halolimnae]|uniref:Uncharacterized protein n=1 Tax=Alkalicoccus halolimnae TaxID=1667239 RepID=A0A5C7F496_9BACI|nr:hypothetical protein [Alkalicoccus halolimnae]TXF83313.1 hypothetical protein FTX54_13120 [Alkalicoccus halolimnae]